MQLFILDREPDRVPGLLCDVHVRKMALETAQILSSVIVLQGGKTAPGMPKPYNLNHPVIRALDSPWKVNWTLRFNAALHAEYRYRFGRAHAYAPLCAVYTDMLFRELPPETVPDWTFGRVFKNFTTDEPDLIRAWRLYCRSKKRVIRNWRYTRRAEPGWLRLESGI